MNGIHCDECSAPGGLPAAAWHAGAARRHAEDARRHARRAMIGVAVMAGLMLLGVIALAVGMVLA